ncbi:MAG TPA: prepilin-type N-terminal cleavage/methylation domain-containing protein [Candidatus Paceibacterota bacterium]|nr:prepilin-type N-terminal cleavage/methylation domain-containing protein [Candidatus Paceibacterota bacterium]
MSNNKGFSLAEIIVAAAIITTMVVAIVQAFSISETLQNRQIPFVKAQLLAEENLEALRLIRNTGWGNLSSIPLNTKQYIYFSGSAWSVATTPEIIDGTFYRSFTLSSVSRDSSSNIVSSGGTNDPNTLFASSTVSWSSYNATSSVSYGDYFMNY